MLKIEIHDFFLSSTERYVFLGHVDKKKTIIMIGLFYGRNMTYLSIPLSSYYFGIKI
jgi:hypothetical protein